MLLLLLAELCWLCGVARQEVQSDCVPVTTDLQHHESFMVLDQSSEQLMVSVFEGTAVCFRKVFSLQPTNTTVCLTLLEESLTASEANR